MTSSPEMRAGDVDRDRTITVLREAFAEGRLTQDEFDARMASAASARTFGDLAVLTEDLPAAAAPAPVPAPVPAGRRGRSSDDLRRGWASWLGVSVLVNVIWGITAISAGHLTYYWPIWVMGPWGAVMVVSTITNRANRPD